MKKVKTTEKKAEKKVEVKAAPKAAPKKDVVPKTCCQVFKLNDEVSLEGFKFTVVKVMGNSVELKDKSL